MQGQVWKYILVCKSVIVTGGGAWGEELGNNFFVVWVAVLSPLCGHLDYYYSLFFFFSTPPHPPPSLSYC